jgi:phosphoribosyl 1,2-cyclic phosphodiesterase
VALEFASLGSGSDGNALVVRIAKTVVMMDCGFGLSHTETRLARLGLTPADINAIVVTHEHGDHVGGVARFARKHGTPVWMTHGTARAVGVEKFTEGMLNYVDPHTPFSINAINVNPYFVPHDAAEPVQFVFDDGRAKLGVLTDTGSSTAHIETMLSGCDALVLECNHDLDLLMNGPYPIGLKRRVSGRFGHLDNQTAAQILTAIDCSKLKHIIAAHLSQRNNTPALAQAALASALHCAPEDIAIAEQESGFGWREI